MRWPGYRHILFDCDSTLTAVEGIDVLARYSDQVQSVASLTAAAMEGQLGLEDVYGRRLLDIQPTRKQVRDVYRVYRKHVVDDAIAVISALQNLGHKVYIVSGGLNDPVMEFGTFLGVPRANIRAVKLSFDQLAGEWWRENAQGPERRANDSYLDFDAGDLTVSDGKGDIIRELLSGQNGRSLLIGDGHSDLLAAGSVDLFVGYGGVVKREHVLSAAPVRLLSHSLAPLLPLAAGPAALKGLSDEGYKELVSKALLLIQEGAITFQDERLKAKFDRALSANRNTSH